MSALHGLLLVKKPQNISSHDVVSYARRALKTKAIGHTGTLDPLATGLMVLVLGEGTKLSDYILNGDKAYRVKVRFGITTDSMDITGNPLSTTECHLKPAEVKQAAESLVGSFLWEVPLHSAIKVDGKKMYDFAHKGDAPLEIPKRMMNFNKVETIEVGEKHYIGQIDCSKGSYIRVWAHQLGAMLNCGGVVEELRRTHSAPYSDEFALDMENLGQEHSSQSPAWQKAFVPISRVLPDWKMVTVSGKDERLIHNGQISFDLQRRLISEEKLAYSQNKKIGIKVLSAESGHLLAIIEAEPQKGLKIRRVFRTTPE